MDLKLIGLVGESRAGKDSVAGVLVSDFPFDQGVMADGIREILLGLNPIIKDNGGVVWELLDLYDQHHGDWDRIKAASSESVDYMIRLGQTCRDVLGTNVWLDRVLPVDWKPGKNGLVISDVRQPNEYARIKQHGGQVWKIVRPGTVKRGMDGLLDGLEFDAVIENRGSLSDLRGVVQATLSSQIHGAYVQRNEFLHPDKYNNSAMRDYDTRF